MASTPSRSTLSVTFEPFPSGSMTCVATPLIPADLVSQVNERFGVSSVTVYTLVGARRMRSRALLPTPSSLSSSRSTLFIDAVHSGQRSMSIITAQTRSGGELMLMLRSI